MTIARRVAALLALILAALTLGTAAPASAASGALSGRTAQAPATTRHEVALPAHSTIDLATGQPVTMKAPQLCQFNYICGWDYMYGPLLFKTSVDIRSCQTAPVRNAISYISNETDFLWTVWISSTICSGGTTGPIYAWTAGNMGGAYDNSIDSWRRS